MPLKKIILNDENLCFHAGTTLLENRICANGGRVLNFVSVSNNFRIARENIFNNLNLLNWNNGFYRKDIGYRVIDK